MKKWKNKKHSSPWKSFTERTMFLKMQNFPSLERNIISTTGKNEKNVNKILQKTLIFLSIFKRMAWLELLLRSEYEKNIYTKCL